MNRHAPKDIGTVFVFVPAGEAQPMKEDLEEWQELCAQAAIEQDPEKLRNLVQRINELSVAKQERLKQLKRATRHGGKATSKPRKRH